MHVFAAGSNQYSWGLDDIAADPGETHGLTDLRLQRFTKSVLDDLSDGPQTHLAH